MNLAEVLKLIRTVPDFPVKGIQFKDISPILENPEAFSSTVDLLAEKVSGVEFDEVIGIDARGFIFGAALAYKLNKGFVMARKENKLPGELVAQSFNYEYSQATLTLQKNNLSSKKSYLIVDDVLATGSTVKAVVQMLEHEKVQCAGILVFIELGFLNGSQKISDGTSLQPENIFSLIKV